MGARERCRVASLDLIHVLALQQSILLSMNRLTQFKSLAAGQIGAGTSSFATMWFTRRHSVVARRYNMITCIYEHTAHLTARTSAPPSD